MRIGDYARINCTVYDTVVINRIAEIFDNTILTENDGSMYQGEYSKEEIIKSSPNIIDLIEVGDYINGHKVFDDMRVDTDDYGNDFIEIGIEIDNMLNHYIREEDIKSIVTKEQFESMEYKIKE